MLVLWFGKVRLYLHRNGMGLARSALHTCADVEELARSWMYGFYNRVHIELFRLRILKNKTKKKQKKKTMFFKLSDLEINVTSKGFRYKVTQVTLTCTDLVLFC